MFKMNPKLSNKMRWNKFNNKNWLKNKNKNTYDDIPLTPSSVESSERYKKILDERRYENIKHGILNFQK
jgi:hypothetical protein